MATDDGVRVEVDEATRCGEVHGMAGIDDMRLEAPATLTAPLAEGERRVEWVTLEWSAANACEFARLQQAHREGLEARAAAPRTLSAIPRPGVTRHA